MNINELRYDIIIQQPIAVKDEYGAETITYTNLYNLKASKKMQGGNKGVDTNEIFNSSNLIFDIYYRNVTEKMLVIYNNKKYRINNIVEIGYKAGQSLYVELINE